MFRYEINVALNGRHLFATHERSLTTEEEMVTVYRMLAERFEEKDGFSITVSYQRMASTQYDKRMLGSLVAEYEKQLDDKLMKCLS